MSVRNKFLTFSLIGALVFGQTLPVLAQEASISGEIATPSSQLESDREIDPQEIFDLIKREKSFFNETASESASATDSADPFLTDLSIPELTPSAQLKIKIKKPSLVKGNLNSGEKLQIDLGDYQAEETEIIVYDSSGKEVDLESEQKEDGQITFDLSNTFLPGKYHLKVIDEITSEVLVEQDFTWGVLAINPNKSIYLPEETIKLAMAVLDEKGMMVCDAKLVLKIISPSGETKELSTEQGTIKVNPECQLHNYTEKPDYEASYQTDKIGAYQMELLAETSNGSFTINDSFEVREQVAFDVERNGPTRIYPPATYNVDFNILANQDFEGVIEETVPSSFEIFPLSEQEESQNISLMTLEQIAAQFDEGKVLGASVNRSYDELKTEGDTKIISWYVSLKKGEQIKLGYRFDAPDISPQFYLLGSLKFINIDGQITFQEIRQWQIAADASPTEYTSGSGQFTAEVTGTHTIILVGGGGGGAGGAAGNANGGGGGGGGASLIKTVSLTQGQGYNYSVGTAGPGGATTQDGTAGGNTTFVVGGITYTAAGGGGGRAPSVYTGGSGGTATNGDTNNTGGQGGTGTVASGSGGGGGAAGTTGNGNPGSLVTAGTAKSLYGGAGGAGTSGNSASGTAATDPYGGGGGGGTKNGSGANGMSGYIRIEWSLPTITVSGTSDVGEGTVVRVAINGSLAGQTGTVTSGNWSITGVTQPSANQIMTVFATDGDGDIADSLESTAIAKYPGSGNMTDMVLNINTLSVGGTGAQSISVSDLVTANYDADQDEDIMYDAETGSLLVEAAVNSYTAEKIDILTTDTLTVSGSETLTTHHLTITGALTSTTTSAYNVTGTWTNNGTFTQASSTVNLNGSGSQTINGSTETAFYNLTVSNTGAAIAVSTNMSVASSGTLNMNGTSTILNPSAGVVISGLGTLTGSGTVKVTRTAATADFSTQYSITNKTLTNLTVDYAGTGQVLSNINYGKLTISTNAISTGANSATVGLGGSGTFTVGASGVFTPSSGTMTFNSGASIVNSNTLTFQGISVAASATVTTSASFSIAGTLTVGASGNFSPSGGTITMATVNWGIINSGTLVFKGLTIAETPSSQPTSSFLVGGTLTVSGSKTLAPTSGTITMSGTSSSVVNSGTLTFNNFAVGSGASASTSDSFGLVANFTNDGAFSASNGTVTFSGADSSTQQISGNSSFYNFNASTAGNSAGRTLQFAGNSTNIIAGTWAVTGYSGKVITLNSSDTNNWTINPTVASVTYVDVYYSTNTGVSFCATYSTKDVNTVGWNVSAGASCNETPNNPSSLAQAKTDDTVLNTGDWTNETSVKFTASADDPDSSDTLYLCVEKDDIDTAFADSEDLCGDGVAYSGTPVTVTVTITGITDATQYHWHARVKDAAAAYSSWVSYGGNSDTTPGADRDFGVDSTAPTGGTVYDGTSIGVDIDFNGGSLSELSANWADINSNASGLDHYEYSIGTNIGGTEVGGWVSVGAGTSATATGLTLQTSAPYYFNVRAIDNANNTQSAVSSDGQVVSPSLSFSVSPGSLTFTNLNAGNGFTDTKNTTLTTSTNAYGGYVIRAFITGLLTATNPSYSIINFNGGTYLSPDEWLTGDRGFGYHSSDTTIQSVDKFNNNPCPGGGAPPCYAPFSLDSPGDIIADHTDNVSGSPISGEEFTITNKVKTDSGQEAFPYSTTVVYTATAYY